MGSSYTDIEVSVNELSVDPQVQRWNFNPRKVEGIVKGFNPDLLNLVTVSKRNAVTYVIIDGWHRWEAVRRLTDNTGKLFCRVYEGLTLADEAQMFMDLNPGNQPSALDKYRMRIHTQDPVILAIDKAVHEYGWAVHPLPAKSHLQCVKALERIQKLANSEDAQSDLLSLTMLVVTRTFGHEREAGTAILLEGIAAFLAVNRKLKQFDLDRLITQLKEYPNQAFGLVSDAQTMSRTTRMRVPMALADQVVKQYNRGLKVGGSTELPPWRKSR